MDSVQQPHAATEEPVCSVEPTVVEEGDGVFRVMLRGLFYPFHIVVRAYRGVLWVLGFRPPKQKALLPPAVTSPPRHSLTGRKRLRPVTRLLLYVLPRWLQGALGFPVSYNIGRALSPEIRASPTKPYGKGSKRKQDDMDEDDEEDEQTWVDVLNQDLADEDEGPDKDPDYEPSSVSTESEEYCSQNNTQSDIEVQEKGVVIIEDMNTDAQLAASPEDPAV